MIASFADNLSSWGFSQKKHGFFSEHRLIGCALSSLLFFALLFLRGSAQLLHPQVWDEDGTQILPGLLRHGFHWIFAPVNGYLIVFPKLISAAALSITGLYYPNVSTLIASCFIVLVCLLVSFSPTWLRGGALLGMATLLVPTSPEVFGIPLYTLWWTGLLLFLLVLWKPDSEATTLRAIMAAIGGLSSPVIFAATPLLALRALIWRKWKEVLVAITASLCCLAQTALLVESHTRQVAGGTGRISLLQLLPKFVGSYFAGSLIRSTEHVLWLAVAVFASFLLSSSRVLRSSRSYLWLLGLWVSTVLSIAARVDVEILNTRWAGPRYFFLPFVLLSWFLVSLMAEAGRKPVGFFAAALLIASLVNLYPVVSRPQRDLRWAQQLQACTQARTYQMQISFDGKDTWGVDMTGEECQHLLHTGVLRR